MRDDALHAARRRRRRVNIYKLSEDTSHASFIFNGPILLMK